MNTVAFSWRALAASEAEIVFSVGIVAEISGDAGGPVSKRPTVTDVAKVARVGASTVSRYLRGVAIKDEAARRVAAAIQELGYMPDEAARALRGGSTKTIGVIVPQVDNSFFSRVIKAIESETHRRGFAIILLLHEEDSVRQLNHLHTLQRYRADGVILASACYTKAAEVSAALSGTPVVAFDRQFSTDVDSVTLRNREAARVATDHLLRHGQSSIACVTAKSDLFTFHERIAGYADAMQAAGLRPQILEAADYGDLRLLMASAMSGRSRPGALLSLSNMATGSILSAFNDLSIPEAELPPLIGFDDFEFAALMRPSLSVIRQPIDLMVRYALELLFRKIELRSAERAGAKPANGHVQAITLSGELVCRRSCGCD